MDDNAPPHVGKEGLYAKFKRKGFSINTFDAVIDTSGGTMKRSLGWVQLMMLGVGTMVGAGVFVATGAVAQSKAGPAVILSYIFAGFASMLSALCYAEYSCDFPLAGGAFNFITATFGEFAGWMVACNLFIEWTLANAAIAKGFSGYFAVLCGIDPKVFKVYTVDLVEATADNTGFTIEVDWLAVVFLFLLTLVLLLGTQEGSWFNNITVVIFIGIIAFIIVAGGTQVDTANYTPFLPYGISGIFTGSSTVFFSFVGFDMVASMAEEAKKPSRDLPVAICTSLTIATAIYATMSTVLVGMVPYFDLDPDAPFSVVFESIGMGWASKLVAVGAVFGCVNSNYGALVGMSRIFVTVSRAGLLPIGMSRMSRRAVPTWSIVASSGIAAILALVLAVEQLFDFVSIGTLVAYGSVCVGVLWRRYHVPGETPLLHSVCFSLQILAIIACGLLTGLGSQYSDSVPFWAVPLGGFVVITGAFHLFPQRFVPACGFAAPLLPWIPASGIMVNAFLCGLLTRYAFIFWGVWTGISFVIYMAYGLHNSQGEGQARRKWSGSGNGTDDVMMESASDKVPGSGLSKLSTGSEEATSSSKPAERGPAAAAAAAAAAAKTEIQAEKQSTLGRLPSLPPALMDAPSGDPSEVSSMLSPTGTTPAVRARTPAAVAALRQPPTPIKSRD